ncbi:hypothetical protein CRE_22353 [Caenorhabditis remanei]|uniref:Protein kinase domain-containing protein n=1 Tax=Caenorhabditis remanei TaxID=31234 RepID=E3MEA0_CAERE|nr:hypothetical protein CRE_22353 [Caenorhabditis remanei]
MELSERLNYSNIRFNSKEFTLNCVVGRGGYGLVVCVKQAVTNRYFALKIEHSTSKAGSKEYCAYIKLADVEGVPQCFGYWTENDFSVIQLELVGMNLLTYMHTKTGKLPIKDVFKLAPQMIDLLKNIHKRGIVHCDIKPSNFAFGMREKSGRLQILDFGLSESYFVHEGHSCCRYKRTPRGTTLYMSANQHVYFHNSPRDDLESLVFCFMDMCGVSLPWINFVKPETERDHSRWYNAKVGGESRKPLTQIPQFQYMLNMCRDLKCNEKPNYEGMKDLFKLNYFNHRVGDVKPRYSNVLPRIEPKEHELEILKQFDINNE